MADNPEPSPLPAYAPPTQPGLARSASVLALGNMVSRILGLVREMVITAYFGQTGLVSAFTVASQAPTMLYDFLVGGMLSAALVPVLSDYAGRPDRRELVGLVGTLISLLGIILAGLVLIVILAADQVAWLMAGGFAGFDPDLLPLTARLIRLTAPAIWLFSMAGLLTAVLYALQRFTFPAIASAVYNLGIVIAAPLLAGRIGIASLVAGMLLGSLAQFLVMARDLLRSDIRVKFQWHHPALTRIFALYLPIGAGLLVSQAQIILDRRLASGTGEESIAWMRTATTLQQMPLGLISVAIALAALPQLSRYFAAGQEDAYRRTLGRGIRMVLLLITPILVGLWLLGEPAIRLLFQRGAFTAADTAQVYQALQIYTLGALFAAIDFPLNYAFYARHNTLLPAIVGVVSVSVYAVAALMLVDSLSFLGLVWADTAKQAAHALIMLGLLGWRVGSLGEGTLRGMGVIALAAAGMVGVVTAATPLLTGLLLPGIWADALLLAGGGGLGVAAYAGFLYALGLPELRQLLSH